MAGTNTREIKRQIKSISNTRQITKAMELVSTAKLKKAKEKLDITKPFFETILETIKEIVKHENSLKHKYITQRELKNTLYIVITADRGLCGGYNSNALKKAVSLIEGDETTPKVITIGKKAKSFFKDSDIDIIESITGISESPEFSDAQNIGKLALKLYNNEAIDDIKLIYTRMITTLNLKASHLELLPVDIDNDGLDKVGSGEEESEDETQANENKEPKEIITFEPSAEEVLDYIIPKYIESVIYGSLIESSAAEQSARRVAMENATDNADEMIDELTLSYNQARQAAITQEITEIVGGAEALKN
jgi:F-type H+-transporting ATPase subunit gamma